MANTFGNFTGSAENAETVTPADSDFAGGKTYRALFVGGAGTLIVTTANGHTVTFNMQAGTILPVVARRVAGASTCTGIVGLI